MDGLKKDIKHSNKALAKAERLYGCASSLAKKIGVSKQCYRYWRTKKTLLPLEKAMRIFIVTKGKISLYDLRPDLKFLIGEFIRTHSLLYK